MKSDAEKIKEVKEQYLSEELLFAEELYMQKQFIDYYVIYKKYLGTYENYKSLDEESHVVQQSWYELAKFLIGVFGFDQVSKRYPETKDQFIKDDAFNYL